MSAEEIDAESEYRLNERSFSSCMVVPVFLGDSSDSVQVNISRDCYCSCRREQTHAAQLTKPIATRSSRSIASFEKRLKIGCRASFSEGKMIASCHREKEDIIIYT